jgi:uncharacterized repeat protein (TIGR01451 family)
VRAVAVANVPAAQSSVIKLVKAADVQSVSQAGDVVTYTFTAKNAGNTTLSDVGISDPLQGLSALSCTPGQPATLAPGEVLTCTADYTVTQADVDAGGVSNTATVTGTTPPGQSVTDKDLEFVPSVRSGKIAVTKLADVPDFSVPDTPITYTVTIRNEGTVTLTDVRLSDDLAGLGAFNCTLPTTLLPNQSVDCKATYRTTQADVDAGGVFNAATATGTPPSGRPVKDSDSLTVPSLRTSQVTLDKTADVRRLSQAGDAVTYTFKATNTGNATLSNVVIADPLPDLSALTCDKAAPVTLAPGEALTCTATYSAKQKDIDDGGVTNKGTVTGTSSTGLTVTDDATLTIPAPPDPKIRLTKDANTSSVALRGEVITYTYRATNAGNVTLKDVLIDDPLKGLSALSCAPSQPTTLAPGEELTCTATYTTTQADIDAGGVLNVASVTGTPPTGPPVTEGDSVFVPAPQSLDLALVKSADKTSVSGVGEAVKYTFTATNGSNVTLSNVSISDPLQGLSALSCDRQSPVSLAPGDALKCTADYAVTQADLDAGRIDNTATASGRPPTGDPLTAIDDLRVPANQKPELKLTKSADVSSVSAKDDPVVYTLKVENTGNVTLSDVTATDPMLATLTCDKSAPVTLPPGQTLTCTGDYAATQADIDAGGIKNTATTTGDAPDGSPVQDSDTATVTAKPDPVVSLKKSVDKASVSSAGDKVTYTLTARNEGNVTLSDVTISDPLKGLPALTCDQSAPVALAPGQTLTCTADYDATQADIDAGGIKNTATTTGDAPDGSPVEDSDTATVSAGANPALSLKKSADKTSAVPVGEQVTYTLTARNEGNVTLSDVSISDPLKGLSAPSCKPASPATLAPGEVLECTATYRVTDDDAERGAVENTATAVGTPPTGSSVNATDSARVVVTPNPAISVVKTADKSGSVKPGTKVKYTYAVTNTGNRSLTDVKLTDDKCSPVQGPSGDAKADGVLAPGEQWVYTCTSKLRETTKNTAVASGQYEPGKRVDSRDTVRVKVVKRTACPITVTLVKPKPKKAGDRLLVKRITTNKKCKVLKPVIICRPIGSSASGETAFCVTKVTKRGRIRVNTRGYDAVRVRVLVRARPKPKQRATWKANTWRQTWTLR